MADSNGNYKKTILVNGREMAVPPGGRLTDLLASLGLDPRYVIVELNQEALLREEYGRAVLRAGDSIEIVCPVAGG